MRKLKLAMLAAAALVPFGWNGASAGAVSAITVDGAVVLVDEDMVETLGIALPATEMGKAPAVESYNCCHVFVWGRWWCIPC